MKVRERGVISRLVEINVLYPFTMHLPGISLQSCHVLSAWKDPEKKGI